MTTDGRKIVNMIIAIVVSIVAWVFVVYNFRPMTQVRHSDVEVVFTGEETLAERGLAISETALEELDVVLRQNRTEARTIKSEDIKITADVSECAAGDNQVQLQVRGPEGTTVVSSERSSISVSVERSRTDSAPVELMYSGDPEEGAEPIAFDMGVIEAEVSCTADRLGRIDKVAALLPYDEVGKAVKSFTCDLVAVDRSGNILPHVIVQPDEMSLDAAAGFTKEVPLNVKVNTRRDDDYTRKYSAPDTVVIKGSKEAIDKVDSIDTAEIDLRYTYESGEVEPEYILPEGIYLANASKGQTVKVTVSENKKTDDET